MYSVVLMMALSGGADVPAWGGHGCYGGGGCYGGAGYGGCYGGGGCQGRGHHFGGLFRHGCHGGGHGWFGGCRGGGCYGGGGGCYGGYYGGCYGGAPAYGGCCGAPAPAYGCTGGPAAMPPPPPGGERIREPKPKDKEKGTKEKEDEALGSAPAIIMVSLPPEAKLTIDGAATTSTSSVRAFASPALERGKDYHYTLKAELIREGKTVTASKRVTVRAGDTTRVALEFPVERVTAE